jgi:hypothetical protein
MRISFFERDYGHLADTDDAVKIFGPRSIHAGVATVGDIRKACVDHPKTASIYPENDGSGFYIADLHGKFFSTYPAPVL